MFQPWNNRDHFPVKIHRRDLTQSGSLRRDLYLDVWRISTSSESLPLNQLWTCQRTLPYMECIGDRGFSDTPEASIHTLPDDKATSRASQSGVRSDRSLPTDKRSFTVAMETRAVFGWQVVFGVLKPVSANFPRVLDTAVGYDRSLANSNIRPTKRFVQDSHRPRISRSTLK